MKIKQNLVFWKQFIESNLEHNLDYIVDNSIKNFHFKGLNYVCFQFSSNLTIRLYIIKPEDNLNTRNVNIHNHLYDSQILVLSGSITNNVYSKTEGDKYNHYYLTSALNPANKTGNVLLDYIGKTNLQVTKSINLSAGDTHFQNHKEIHSVNNDPSSYTAFMVFEFKTVKQNSTLFSTEEFKGKIDTKKDIYEKFTEREIVALLQGLISKIEGKALTVPSREFIDNHKPVFA